MTAISARWDVAVNPDTAGRQLARKVQNVRGDSSAHYHEERPHQGVGNELIAPTTPVIGTGPIICRERLGGLLKFYYREAA